MQAQPFHDESQPRARGAAKPPPILTAIICAVCVLVFLDINFSEYAKRPPFLLFWFMRPTAQIWQGAYWTLITTVFVHAEIWHIFFNLYWLWILGAALEREIGTPLWALFFVAAAFVSSAVQLFTGSLGIGMSGVGYALFGFAWLARDKMLPFRRIVDQRLANLFLIWLVGCIVVTQLHIARIANAAHVGGLIFGVLTAMVFVRRERLGLFAPLLAALVVLSFVPLFWCPLSPEWRALHAPYRAPVTLLSPRVAGQ